MVPSGADATTSVGPGCKTPCSVDVAAPEAGFSVTFTMTKFQPVTVPVRVIYTPGDFTTPTSSRSSPIPWWPSCDPPDPPPKAVARGG